MMAPIEISGEPVGVICWEPMEEIRRKPDGEPRWCFHCRTRRDFEYVVTAPRELFSYYGPTACIECAVCHTTDGDCFPGRYREWSEE